MSLLAGMSAMRDGSGDLGGEMKAAHRLIQEQLLAIGKCNGFDSRRSFNSSMPADAVWFMRNSAIGEVPVAAFEIAVSEGPKRLRGSIMTLEQISPAVGIIVLADAEFIRGHVRDGNDRDDAERLVGQRRAIVDEVVATSRQRLLVWTDLNVDQEYRMAVGRDNALRASKESLR